MFEKKRLILEDESSKIIVNLMKQSDDGISHLMTSYANKKGRNYVDKLNKAGYFNNRDCRIRFWELDSKNYDCFSKVDMGKQITDLLSVHYQSKMIEGRDIETAMVSKYRDMVLDGIEYYGYSILSPDIDLIPELECRGIKYFGCKEQDEKDYIPFEHGYIHKEDFKYIAKYNLSYVEVAQYADGWYSCLPFVDVFLTYEKFDIQKDYMEILHNSMYARVSEGDYIGNWNLLLGNIPHFLLQYEIDADWEKIYNVFKKFLDISLIWHCKQ